MDPNTGNNTAQIISAVTGLITSLGIFIVGVLVAIGNFRTLTGNTKIDTGNKKTDEGNKKIDELKTAVDGQNEKLLLMTERAGIAEGKASGKIEEKDDQNMRDKAEKL